MLRTTLVLSLLVLLAPAPDARAQSCGTPAAGASTVHLRKDCSSHPNCIDDSPGCGLAAVGAWLWGTRNPGPGDAVVVEIGPGDFEGTIQCTGGDGWVSFRGDGREASRVVAPAPGTAAVWLDACQAIGFQDLEIDGSALGTTVLIQAGGTSTFTDVDLVGNAGIYDWLCGGAGTDPPVGEHLLTGVEIDARGFGLASECSRFQASSSAIRVSPASGTAAATFTGILVAHRGEVEMLGGSVHVGTGELTSSGSAFHGVSVGTPILPLPVGHGTFRMHAGLVSVDTRGIAGKDAHGLVVEGGSSGDAWAVASGTGFELRSDATAHRLSGNGWIEAPQLRPAALDPEPGWASLAGSDLFVETGCEIGGDCDADACDDQGDPDCAPRLMIHWPACGSSPWWDAASGGCRQ